MGNYHLLYRLAIHSSYSEMATQQQFLNLTGLYPNAHYLVKVIHIHHVMDVVTVGVWLQQSLYSPVHCIRVHVLVSVHTMS